MFYDVDKEILKKQNKLENLQRNIDELEIVCKARDKYNIPKEVTFINYGEDYFLCPNCDEIIDFLYDKENNKYCYHCGQKLDWGEMGFENEKDL